MHSECNVILSHYKNMFLGSITNRMMKRLGQIDKESEDHIPNNDADEEVYVHVNNNEE